MRVSRLAALGCSVAALTLAGPTAARPDRPATTPGFVPGALPPPPAADTIPPSDPAPVSTSHNTGVPSTKLSVVVTWAGASDYGSGVDGYSLAWDGVATTVPDTVKDVEETVATATSPVFLAGHSYWFHLRTSDNAGNWSAGVHLGPFVIANSPGGFCLVPRVVGKTLAAAKLAIQRARCATGPIMRRRSSRFRRGRVMAQRPAARARRVAGSRVSLTLSRGRR